MTRARPRAIAFVVKPFDAVDPDLPLPGTHQARAAALASLGIDIGNDLLNAALPRSMRWLDSPFRPILSHDVV